MPPCRRRADAAAAAIFTLAAAMAIFRRLRPCRRRYYALRHALQRCADALRYAAMLRVLRFCCCRVFEVIYAAFLLFAPCHLRHFAMMPPPLMPRC